MSVFVRAYFKAKRLTALNACKKRALFTADRSVVSFTFDDFPASALETGGAILESAGVRGTYYASFGLAGKERRTGAIGSREFMESCVDRGHELGCHTFSHLNCARTAVSQLAEDCDANRFALDSAHAGAMKHFAYPYGSFDISSKRWVGSRFESARSVEPGVNRRAIDLSALLAYSIDVERGGSAHRAVLESLRDDPGWAIFYTHDVSEKPTEFGCTVAGFEALVSACVGLGYRILPVGAVVRESVASA